MAGTRGTSVGATIVASDDHQRLLQACPDLEDWPRRWQGLPEDIAVGEALLAVLEPFLLDLLDQGLARSTFRRHRDNACALGGALIHDRYYDRKLAALPAEQALRQLVENDEAPLMWAGVRESEQRTYDTTARKLNKFLQRDLNADPPKSSTAQRRHGGDRATPQTRKPGRRRSGA